MGTAVSKNEQVYNAAQAGDARLVRDLILQGASPDLYKDKKHRTALIVAASHAETYDVLVTLLQLNANIRAYRPGKDGGFALHHAARRGLERTVALLLQWGADPLASNDDGETALDVARARGFVALVRMLEDRVCLFCGSLTQQSGALLGALASNWFDKKWWVVVIPVTWAGSRTPRLEVVLYSSPKTATPAKIIALAVPPDVLLTKENTPDASVTITDSKTKTKYKLAAAKDADNPSVVLQLYNACLGVPQGPRVQFPVPVPGPSQPPPANPDKGKDLAQSDDVALQLAIQESLNHATEQGIPVPNVTVPPRGDDSGSSRQNPSSHGGSHGASSSAGKYGGWDNTSAPAYSGWGPGPSRPGPSASPQTPGTSSANAPPPPGSPVPSPTMAPATGGAGLSMLSGWGGAASAPSPPPPPGPAVPSAPPLPSEEAIHYPVIGAEGGESSKTEGLCVVCMDAPSNAVCIPCGHVAGCLTCLTEIHEKGWGCPVCRTPIREVVKVYMATS